MKQRKIGSGTIKIKILENNIRTVRVLMLLDGKWMERHIDKELFDKGLEKGMYDVQSI